LVNHSHNRLGYMEDRIRSFSGDQDLVSQRRKHIIECSVRLFVKKGFHQTTMRELAKECGMSQGLIYHYVASKQDILYMSMTHMASMRNELHEKLSEVISTFNPTDALREAIKMYFQWSDRHQDWLIFVNREILHLSKTDRQMLLEGEADSVRFFETLLIKGRETGEFKIEDPASLAHTIIMLRTAWATRRWFLRKRWTLEDYTRKHTAQILDAARASGSCVIDGGTASGLVKH